MDARVTQSAVMKENERDNREAHEQNGCFAETRSRKGGGNEMIVAASCLDWYILSFAAKETRVEGQASS